VKKEDEELKREKRPIGYRKGAEREEIRGGFR